jgi:hypothetical protein
MNNHIAIYNIILLAFFNFSSSHTDVKTISHAYIIIIITTNHTNQFIQLIISVINLDAHDISILLVQFTHHILEQLIFEYTESTNVFAALININHIIEYNTVIFHDFI